MLSEPTFLTVRDVIALHEELIERYGGSSGIRDPHALQSAVNMPQTGWGDRYFHEDLYEMAAAYLFHLTQGHPFVDGNKRIGAAAADVFLSGNGLDLQVGQDEYKAVVLLVAQGQMDKKQLAQFFRERSVTGSP